MELKIKKEWVTPEVHTYGDIETLTQGTGPALKQPGSFDDFAVNASNFP